MGVTEVTYTLEPEDYRRFEQHVVGRNRRLFFLLLPLLALAVQAGPYLLHGWRTGFRFKAPDNWLVVVGATVLPLAFFAVFWIVLFRLARREQEKNLRNAPGVLEPRTARLMPDHLYIRWANGETITYWRSLLKVEETEHYLYIFESKQSAHVIPKRAFASEAQAREFCERARGYWAAAKGHQPAPPIPPPGG